MGIRFYCPNGHKLNVKEFQAGKPGICPHCGVKLLIPTESTRSPSKRDQHGTKQQDAAAGAVEPTPTSPPAKADDDSSVLAPVEVPASGPAATDVPGGPPTPSAATDPLAEAGEMVWYVKPASGGQFGPAVSEVMRAWVEEGRVGADSLVWREGWQDWEQAARVFPQLGAGRSSGPTIRVAVDAPTHAAARDGLIRTRRPSRSTRALWVAVLVALVVILGIVLLWVVFRKPSSSTPVASCCRGNRSRCLCEHAEPAKVPDPSFPKACP